MKTAAIPFVALFLAGTAISSGQPTVTESAREIPVAATADVVVVGGSCGAVAAATSAAKAGASVFLIAPRTYLGEDLAGTLRLWLEPGETPTADLAKQVYSDPVAGEVTSLPFTYQANQVSAEKHKETNSICFVPGGKSAEPNARPLRVKQVLEKALLDAKVDFLFGCYATDLLVDQAGQPCGVVMANRAGRQAVIGKTIIDATEHATVARLAGAEVSAFKPGKQTVHWVVIAGKARDGARPVPLPVTVRDLKGQGFAKKENASWFEYTLDVDLPDDSWAARARLEQHVRDLTYDASQLYAADSPSVPAPVVRSNSDRLWVLNAGLRPIAAIDAGTELGAKAATAKQLPAPTGVKVHGEPAPAGKTDEVKESLGGIRPLPVPAKVPSPARALPVIGEYDVVVVGGGTAGAPAGIAAAKQGAKTLVLEYLHGLGGVSTLGMIGKYWYGNRVGFSKTVPENPIEVRMEFFRRELRQAGADIWFGVMGCGALIEGHRCTGVIVATPFGRGVVRAKIVIDATGNAEIPAVAGAPTAFVEDNFVLQNSHMPRREVGSSYINGNIPPVDVADPLDVRATLLRPLGKAFDRGTLVDSRERQRIVGDYCLDWLDQINRRTFPDSIVLATSDYDSHGAQVHPFFMLRPARPPADYRRAFWSYVPYRCLLPQGWEGMLVVGLGASAHRDAVPIIRMQPDLQHMGYAAGVAAAMAVKGDLALRSVNIRDLQKQLVKAGNLPASVLNEGDSYPFPKTKIAAAVKQIPEDYGGLEVVMAQPEDSLPLLRAAYTAASGEAKLHYANTLGVMGDATGIETLLAEAKRRLKEPPPLAMPERLLWALGGTRDPRAIPALAELIGQPGEQNYRAIVVSLGRMANPAGMPVLVDLLQKAKPDTDQELITACALYRCGDKDGLAKRTLERIAAGSNSPFSRLAWQVLSKR